MGLKELFLTADGRLRLRFLLLGFDGRMSRADFWRATLATYIIYVIVFVMIFFVAIQYIAVFIALAAIILAVTNYRATWFVWCIGSGLLLLMLALLGLAPFVAIGLMVIAFILGLNSHIAVANKRLHDLGWSGWWQLVFWGGQTTLGLIEIGRFGGAPPMALELAGLALFVAMIVIFGGLRGVEGPNKYGPDPVAATEASAAA
jgi:uncharacterized membrane protein YhaH (DUF805 family)